ncbi:MAG TPA: hypothetical protein VMP08_03075 [Anaerolineae bacterium]|nr:hypothetical protein [Anaerolineae bacterium]
MDQRIQVLTAIKQYMATRPDSPRKQRAQAFVDLIEQNPDMCWDDLAEEFRNNYYDAFDEIVPALTGLDDPLITYNCVRLADANNIKEVLALKQVAESVDSYKHQVSLRAMAKTRSADLLPVIKGKADLPNSLRVSLGLSKSNAPAAKLEMKHKIKPESA